MWRDEAYLLDILVAARKVLGFTQGVTWEEFQRSDLLQNAVMRPLIAKRGRAPFFDSAEKPLGMLRQAQHERKILKIITPLPVRPEPRRRVNASFSAESFFLTCDLVEE